MIGCLSGSLRGNGSWWTELWPLQGFVVAIACHSPNPTRRTKPTITTHRCSIVLLLRTQRHTCGRSMEQCCTLLLDHFLQPRGDEIVSRIDRMLRPHHCYLLTDHPYHDKERISWRQRCRRQDRGTESQWLAPCVHCGTLVVDVVSTNRHGVVYGMIGGGG
jgi:hypothetical protein